MVKSLLFNRFVIPTILVVIVAVVLFNMIQPLAKPAFEAIQRQAESLEIVYVAANTSKGNFNQGGFIIPHGPSFGWRNDDNGKDCRIYGFFQLLDREFRPDKVIDKAHCTASNVGSAFDKFFDGIKRYLEEIKSTADSKVWDQARITLNQLLENAKAAGLKISVSPIP